MPYRAMVLHLLDCSTLRHGESFKIPFLLLSHVLTASAAYVKRELTLTGDSISLRYGD